MRALTSLALVAFLLAAGCNRPAPAPELKTATSPFQGYTFVVEYPDGTPPKFEGRRTDDGAGDVAEDITVTCGERVLRIVDGNLTLNGAGRGAVKPGETIALTSAGKVTVNQQPRGE